MAGYQNILLAVDFTPGIEAVCRRAKEQAGGAASRLRAIHVVEPVVTAPPYEGLPSLPVDLEQQMLDSARKSLAELLERVGLEGCSRSVEVGSVKWTIIESAREWGTDLIVMGSHGRHGLQRLLGSTANAVLHAAPCDVLAVRVEPAASSGS